MSAQAQREETALRISRQVNEHAEALIGHAQAEFGQMRYLQGIVQGLRIAAQQNEDAYKAIGG